MIHFAPVLFSSLLHTLYINKKWLTFSPSKDYKVPSC